MWEGAARGWLDAAGDAAAATRARARLRLAGGSSAIAPVSAVWVPVAAKVCPPMPRCCCTVLYTPVVVVGLDCPRRRTQGSQSSARQTFARADASAAVRRAPLPRPPPRVARVARALPARTPPAKAVGTAGTHARAERSPQGQRTPPPEAERAASHVELQSGEVRHARSRRSLLGLHGRGVRPRLLQFRCRLRHGQERHGYLIPRRGQAGAGDEEHRAGARSPWERRAIAPAPRRAARPRKALGRPPPRAR